jgi:multidrug efflux pump subunit AcrB
MSSLVAEIYGMDYAGQLKVAKDVQKTFQATADIVDIDTSVEAAQKRLVIEVDRQKAALLGVSQDAIASAIDTVLRGEDVVFLHGQGIKYAVPIRVEFPVELKDKMSSVLALRVRSVSGALVPMSELVKVQNTAREHSVYHKDLLPVVYVTGDMAGKTDSP